MLLVAVLRLIPFFAESTPLEDIATGETSKHEKG
jgi:hypothetical protein